MKTALLPFAAFAALLGACNKDAPPSDGRPEFQVSVGATGYEPSVVNAPANTPIRLVFTRTTDEGCGQQLVVASQDIRRDLPLDEPVAVDLTTPASGTVRFSCGMDMYDGAIVVQ
jgi:plastocyanin domain-containing protein